MKPALRHRSRKFAMQALYAWQVTKDPLRQIIHNVVEDSEADKYDREYLENLVFGVNENIVRIDELIAAKLQDKRALHELTGVELAVLRVACFEFLFKIDVPYRVIINEALEINKKFGTQDGFRFVNGVLDNLSKELRACEIN
jgi:N utilization substance protein B